MPGILIEVPCITAEALQAATMHSQNRVFDVCCALQAEAVKGQQMMTAALQSPVKAPMNGPVSGPVSKAAATQEQGPSNAVSKKITQFAQGKISVASPRVLPGPAESVPGDGQQHQV